MRIAAVGRAFPEHYYDQETIGSAMLFLWDGEEHKNIKRLKVLFNHVQVTGRHLSLPLEQYAFTRTWGDANDAWIRVGLEVGEKSVLDALELSGLEFEDIGAFFSVSVTGIATPSLEARLMNKMALPRNIKRVPIFGLGCVAGAAGIARAADYVKAFPDQAALVLSVELCSLPVPKDDFSMASIIATGLFGDGSACVAVVGEQLAKRLEERERKPKVWGPRVLATRSIFYPDSEELMGWDISERGFSMVLSSGVPDVARRLLPGDVDAFLADQGVKRSDIKSWVCHPGGPKVIDAIQQGLRLADEDVALSRRSLAEIGNLSSSSVLMVLRDTMHERRPEAGSLGMVLAMGPGFCSELVLVEW